MTKHWEVSLKEDARQNHWMPVKPPKAIWRYPSGAAQLGVKSSGLESYLYFFSGNRTSGKFFNNSNPLSLHPWSGDTNSTHLIRLLIWYNNQKNQAKESLPFVDSLSTMCQALGNEPEAPPHILPSPLDFPQMEHVGRKLKLETIV